MKGRAVKTNISMEQYQECPKCGMVVIDYDENDPPTRKEIALEWKYHNEVECVGHERMTMTEIAAFCRITKIFVTFKCSKALVIRQIRWAIDNQIAYAVLTNNKFAEEYWRGIDEIWDSILATGKFPQSMKPVEALPIIGKASISGFGVLSIFDKTPKRDTQKGLKSNPIL